MLGEENDLQNHVVSHLALTNLDFRQKYGLKVTVAMNGTHGVSMRNKGNFTIIRRIIFDAVSERSSKCDF